jgi:hypothetical protein
MGWKMYVLGVLGGLAGTGLFLATVVTWSWVSFAALLAVMLAIPFAYARWFELVPISKNRVSRERLLLGGMLGVIVVGAVVSGLLA